MFKVIDIPLDMTTKQETLLKPVSRSWGTWKLFELFIILNKTLGNAGALGDVNGQFKGRKLVNLMVTLNATKWL